MSQINPKKFVHNTTFQLNYHSACRLLPLKGMLWKVIFTWAWPNLQWNPSHFYLSKSEKEIFVFRSKKCKFWMASFFLYLHHTATCNSLLKKTSLEKNELIERRRTSVTGLYLLGKMFKVYRCESDAFNLFNF